MNRPLAVVVALLGLAACKLPEVQYTSPNLDTPEPLILSGTYVHEGSGIAFPLKAAGFTRVEPKRYDRDGKDVGIGYRRIWTDTLLFRAEATVFVFPSQRGPGGAEVPFDDQFEGEVAEVRRGKDEVIEVCRIDKEAQHAGRPVHVRAAEFTFRGDEAMGRQPLVTILAAFLDGPWHVTYRLTIPPPRRDRCLAAFEDLLRELDLPPIGLMAETQTRR